MRKRHFLRISCKFSLKKSFKNVKGSNQTPFKVGDNMEFIINNRPWYIKFVSAASSNLRRSDGSLTVGVTDGNDNCVYLSDLLSGAFLKKVLCHELCHCFMMSYNISIPIEQEEFLADWISIYGEDLIYLLDDLMSTMSREVQYG